MDGVAFCKRYKCMTISRIRQAFQTKRLPFAHKKDRQGAFLRPTYIIYKRDDLHTTPPLLLFGSIADIVERVGVHQARAVHISLYATDTP